MHKSLKQPHARKMEVATDISTHWCACFCDVFLATPRAQVASPAHYLRRITDVCSPFGFTPSRQLACLPLHTLTCNKHACSQEEGGGTTPRMHVQHLMRDLAKKHANSLAFIQQLEKELQEGRTWR